MTFNYRLFIILIFLFPITVHADGFIFYKYADGDSYSMFISSENEMPDNPSARDTIAKRLAGVSFSLKDISSEFYKINATSNIVFFGDNLTQYTIEPLSADRFNHIVWVTQCGKLVKTEVYDVSKRLVFAYSYMDFDAAENADKPKPKDRTLKPLSETPFYKGFYHALTKNMTGNILHFVFMDGINKFSIFINPKPAEAGTVSKIIYGNYLLSKVVSGVEYTVVGSVPYDFMEEVIKVMDSSKAALFEAAKKGKPITEDLLKIHDR